MKPKKANYGFIREAFMIKRYHTVGYINQQETVGHHTANVVAMMFHMYDDNPPIYMVRHALHHDVPELTTGDIPAPVKWANAKFAQDLLEIEKRAVERIGLESCELTPEEVSILKYVDMTELVFKCLEEMMVGNDLVIPIFQRGLVYIHALLQKELKEHRAAHELWDLMKSNPYINIEEFIVERDGPRIITH